MKLKDLVVGFWIINLILVEGVAFARKVNISMPGDASSLKLTNPSAVTVNFDLKCYDLNGSVILNQTGQSLASKAGTHFEFAPSDSGLCQGSTAPEAYGTDLKGKNVYLCKSATPVNYANANSLCGVGNSLCFPPVQGCTIMGINPPNCGAAWLKRETNLKIGSMPWGQPPSCGSWVALCTNFAPIYSCSSYYYMTPNCGQYRLASTSQVDETTTQSQAICCPDPVLSASTCEVNITSTDKAATLASPDFKGGVPF